MPTAPALAPILLAPLPSSCLRSVVLPAFAAVVAAGFLLPQDREHSFVLNAFWACWWPGVFLVYPFLGRVWCAVCPFMVSQRSLMASCGLLQLLGMRWPRSQAVAAQAWPLACGWGEGQGSMAPRSSRPLPLSLL